MREGPNCFPGSRGTFLCKGWKDRILGWLCALTKYWPSSRWSQYHLSREPPSGFENTASSSTSRLPLVGNAGGGSNARAPIAGAAIAFSEGRASGTSREPQGLLSNSSDISFFRRSSEVVFKPAIAKPNPEPNPEPSPEPMTWPTSSPSQPWRTGSCSLVPPLHSFFLSCGPVALDLSCSGSSIVSWNISYRSSPWSGWNEMWEACSKPSTSSLWSTRSRTVRLLQKWETCDAARFRLSQPLHNVPCTLLMAEDPSQKPLTEPLTSRELERRVSLYNQTTRTTASTATASMSSSRSGPTS